jgi:hypothetical protein
MPHACAAPKGRATATTATVSLAPHEMTHICEAPDSTTAYCGIAVDVVDPQPSDCSPTKHGPTHGRCQSECRRRHGGH